MPIDLESPNPPELGNEEATPITTKEVQLSITEEQSPFKILTGVFGALEPQQEVAES